MQNFLIGSLLVAIIVFFFSGITLALATNNSAWLLLCVPIVMLLS